MKTDGIPRLFDVLLDSLVTHNEEKHSSGFFRSKFRLFFLFFFQLNGEFLCNSGCGFFRRFFYAFNRYI